MANNDNIIYAKFNHGREITTDSRSQYAYGQVLKISGLHLPASFDADVSNKGDKQAKAVIGTDNELLIDDAFFLSGKDVIVMINVHAADKDGRTKYIIRIPVEKRPERADIELEPVEQDVISVAIAALNEAVEQTSASAESAENSANRAHESAVNAETSATSASNSEVLAQQYMERAETAAENAEQSKTKAKTSEDNAKASETYAEQIATEIEQYTERAETASTNAESSASTATQKATEASASASTASTKADEALTSATNAQNSANNAQQSATDAQESANSASASASRALVNAEKTQNDKEIVELAKSNVVSAVGEAQNYATTAQSASQAIQDMNVEAVTLGVDSDVTVEKSVDPVTGAVTLTYGIPKGVKGDKGDQGIQGEQGERGEKGDAGSKGDKGDPFVYSDFTPEQLASLKGEKGDKGDQGIQGIQGEQGIQGIQGIKGDAGDKGDKGDAFTYSDFTPEQLASLKGEKGDKGDAFKYSDFTPQQLASLKGDKGDKGDAFTYADFTPEQLASLKGERGEQGIQGVQGEKGDAFTYSDFTPEQLASLKGEKGDSVIVDPIPTQGSTNAVSSGGVYSALADKADKDDVSETVTPTETDADFYLSDANGNVIFELADGHIKTKNFDSSDIDIDTETDTTLSVQGKPADAKAVGDAISAVEDDIQAVEESIPDVSGFADVKTPQETTADLFICDSRGNVIAELKNGHIRTKNFNSENVGTDIIGTTRDNTAQLYICDTNGNVIAELADGHINTKYFDSAEIKALVEKHDTPIWAGKKWACVGDSLTESYRRASKLYHDYVSEATGIAAYNMGHSGCGYAMVGGYGKNFIGIAGEIPNDADVITVFGSGNDMSAGLDIGTITDTGNTTLCGCINQTLDVIFNNHPLVPVGVITPTPWMNIEPSDTNAGATKMQNYVEAIVQICARRGIPCLDLYHCSNLHPSNATFRTLAYSKDDGEGTHPDEKGHTIIAPRFEAFLKTLLLV